MSEKVLTMILAGGQGSRLQPLTLHRAKPAVPFGGRYRIIDFVLSNFVNSELFNIKVLTQYKSNSLNRHISRGWRLSIILDHYIEPVPAQQRVSQDWYRGSADAIYQNLEIVTEEKPDYVIIFGGDHIYKMDVRQMLDYHKEKSADLTVAAIPVPVEEAHQFGIIEVNEDWQMIGFKEKPRSNPATIPGNPNLVLASMGNYIFSTEPLMEELTRDADQQTSHDFGKNIIPQMLERGSYRNFVYNFGENRVPGMAEQELGYWRDVGTIDSYWRSSKDLVSVSPIFSLYNPKWPVRTAYYPHSPAKFVFAMETEKRMGIATDSLICEGCILSGGHADKSILSPNVRLNSFSFVTESILFEDVDIGRHCKIKRTIIDKHVRVPENTKIGYDLEADKKRFTVTESGIVVVPKNYQF
jgi:glucose-1-phosphate adenylyltransferase